MLSRVHDEVLEVASLGTVDYEAAARLQEELVARRLAGAPDRLLLLEHEPVYTLGRGGDPAHLGAAAAGAVPVVPSARGGEATYHGPGQLVGYPILDLGGHKPDVRWYVGRLEQVLLDALACWGIAGRREAGAPGVWVGTRKIASIGIAIRRWVSWHGFALNVTTDLGHFGAINPCGFDSSVMTSMEKELGHSPQLSEVKAALGDEAARLLGKESDARVDEASPAT